MRERYIRGKGLREIDKRPNTDSALWAKLLDDRNKFNDVMICNSSYVFLWIGAGIFSFKNAVESIREKKEPDTLAKGVWSSGIMKHDVIVWRTQSKRITTKFEMATKPRSRHENTDCLLCEGPKESQTHLFFRCDFAKEVWKDLQVWKRGLFTT